MDQQSDSLTGVLVSDESEAYVLEEYLTRTDDVEAFRRRAGPHSRVTPLSEDEYCRLLANDDTCSRDLVRCLRREGVSVGELDRETVGRIMRAVRDALDDEIK